MKTLATCLTCLSCFIFTTSSLAQGLLHWANSATTLISVNGVSMPVRTSPQTTYYFGLFVAPLGTPAPAPYWGGINDPNWQFVAAYTMNSTAAAGAGRMQNPGTVTIVGYEAGTSVNFIVRGWQSWSGGADWPVAKSGLNIFGQSALGTATLGGQSPGGPIFTTPTAFGTDAGQIGGFYVGYPEDIPPEFLVNPSNTVVSVGSDVTLTTRARHHQLFAPIAYQWRKQSGPIAGATSTNLILTNVTLADAGSYDVLASNLFGSATSSVATVTVFIPAIAATLSSPTYTPDDEFQFTVTGTAGSNYVVQVATNLSLPATWVSLFTNASPFSFVDSNAQNFPQQFYRAQAR